MKVDFHGFHVTKSFHQLVEVEVLSDDVCSWKGS
jgi:hypothetical protein